MAVVWENGGNEEDRVIVLGIFVFVVSRDVSCEKSVQEGGSLGSTQEARPAEEQL
jgi:hypothetical protein